MIPILTELDAVRETLTIGNVEEWAFLSLHFIESFQWEAFKSLMEKLLLYLQMTLLTWISQRGYKLLILFTYLFCLMIKVHKKFDRIKKKTCE